MLTLLLFKCCKAFSLCFYTGDTKEGRGWRGISWADYLSCTPAHPSASLPVNLIKQLPLAKLFFCKANGSRNIDVITAMQWPDQLLHQ